MKVDWYEQRDRLEADMVFRTTTDDIVRLRDRDFGDGSRWFVDDWIATRSDWYNEGNTVEPSDLVEQVEDPAAANSLDLSP